MGAGGLRDTVYHEPQAGVAFASSMYGTLSSVAPTRSCLMIGLQCLLRPGTGEPENLGLSTLAPHWRADSTPYRLAGREGQV